MNVIRHTTYNIGVLLCLTMALLLSACSSDSTSDVSPVDKTQDRVLSLSAGVQEFLQDHESSSAPGITRAITYPDATWSAYSPGVSEKLLLFIAKQKEDPASSDILSRLLMFSSNSNDWQTNITIVDAKSSYSIYGFLPVNNESVSLSLVSPSTNYKNGGQLTIAGLTPLTDTDPCVIVGVSDNQAAKNSDVTLQWGKFDFKFKEGEGDVTDYMSILLDHLFSQYSFKIKMDEDYAKLRKIRITKMTVEPIDDQGNALSSIDVTIPLVANSNNSNPLGTLTYSRHTGGTSAVKTLYESNSNPLELTSSVQDLASCQAAADQRLFRITTSYQVLNRQGQLIRTEENVSNKINLSITSTTPGTKHTVTITVNPTYLYVLSDPDLDNPKFEI